DGQHVAVERRARDHVVREAARTADGLRHHLCRRCGVEHGTGGGVGYDVALFWRGGGGEVVGVGGRGRGGGRWRRGRGRCEYAQPGVLAGYVQQAVGPRTKQGRLTGEPAAPDQGEQGLFCPGPVDHVDVLDV